MQISIESYTEKYEAEVLALIAAIQIEEFDIHIDLSMQPDLDRKSVV